MNRRASTNAAALPVQGPLSRRTFSHAVACALGAWALPGCGGGGGGGDTGAATAAPSPGLPAPVVNPTPPPAGSTLVSLTVHSSSAGTFPYAASVLPTRGLLPAGQVFQSPDDGSLSSSVLATWDDGSAALVVVAGSTTVAAGGASTLRLQAGAPASTPALTTGRVGALVNSVSVAFGGSLGTSALTSFGSPERVWWANAQVICARYRVPAPGLATLEAVIDIHAYASGRALVEVVVENGKLDTATATASTVPAPAGYTSAVVSVNGATVATVNAALAPEGAHAGFRAWYASSWVGGDPGLRVTQAAADLQQHPLLFKVDQPSAADLGIYATDAYVPWGAGRHRGTAMGAAGDHPSIGPLPQWEAQFLQSGDWRAAQAVEASALSLLGFDINYRDAASGLVPDASQLTNRTQTSSERNWPRTPLVSDTLAWEVAHHPAGGLMAFVCRPAPVYIELAQKIAVWNATWAADSYQIDPAMAATITDKTGIFGGAYQMRGRAWGLRSLAHATFLSPDGSAWKAGGRYWLDNARKFLDFWRTDVKAVLGFFWDSSPAGPQDAEPGDAGFQTKLWQHYYLSTELHKAAAARLLSGAQQTALSALADWATAMPVRYVNEQSDGAWRYHWYDQTVGRDAATIDSLATWGAQAGWDRADHPPAVAGPWMNPLSQTAYAGSTPDASAGAYYPSYFWSALVAGVERQVAGSAAAWATVQANLSNLANWRAGFAVDPRWGSTPRNT